MEFLHMFRAVKKIAVGYFIFWCWGFFLCFPPHPPGKCHCYYTDKARIFLPISDKLVYWDVLPLCQIESHF